LVVDKEKLIQVVEGDFRNFLTHVGINLEDEHSKDTPKRIAKMYINELLSGMFEDPPKMTTFTANTKDMIRVTGIDIKSICAHHFVPFFGICDILYIPNEKLLGLSKFSRVVNWVASRPQIQEQLTQQICDFLSENLQPKALAVGCYCIHLCARFRGPKSKSGTMETTSVYVDPNLDEEERLNLIDIMYEELNLCRPEDVVVL